MVRLNFVAVLSLPLPLLATAQSSSSSSVAASSCSSTLTASHPPPSIAPGFTAQLVAQNLTAPRGIQFDSNDNLLVVEQNKGITILRFTTSAGCIVETRNARTTIIEDSTLNHGIAINGSTLFASSTNDVYSWAYDAGSARNTSGPLIRVSNMTGEDHTTRTLQVSKFRPGMMVVTRGSVSNIDPEAEDLGSGHSQVKAFDFGGNASALDFSRDGILLGWGLRNDVGVDEHPVTGGIYTVENSVDEMVRDGIDIHQDNPAEELNFLGYLNGTFSPNQGRNFGYPECYSAWNASDVPHFNGTVGDQFAIGDQNSTVNDTTCSAANRQAPRLVFQAHMAPLDILFNDAGTAAWVTFHGSWDRTNPVGYKLSVVSFADGEPVAASNSTTAAIDIVSNRDNSVCPGGCFRPVGLAWDSQGRLFMSSDATGEIYAILRSDDSPTSSVGSNATGTIPEQSTSSGSSSTGSSATPSSSKGAAAAARGSVHALAVVIGAAALWL